MGKMINKPWAMNVAKRIPGMLNKKEESWLFDTFRDSRSHLEIGVFTGKSMFSAASGFKNEARIVGVDPMRKNNQGVGARWVREVQDATIGMIQRTTNATDVVMMFEDSYEALPKLLEAGERFDSVFIDASHNYEETLFEIVHTTKMINPGGILAGHDYHNDFRGVIRAVKETGRVRRVQGTRMWWRIIE